MSEQGTAYLGFIGDELSREFNRRDKLNTAATAVIASAGTLLTLSIGVVTFLRGQVRFAHHSGWTVLVAVGLYLLSALLGLVASTNKRYQVVAHSTMLAMLTTHWTDTETSARNSIGKLMVRSINSLRTGNNAKSRWLLAAVISEMVAIAFAGLAVYLLAD